VIHELPAVEHCDVTASVADDAGGLQPERGLGHAFATDAQCVGDLFVRRGNVDAGRAVQALQQETAQPLFERVVAIARGQLRHLRHQRLDVSQQQLPQRCGLLEHGLDGMGRTPQRPAGAFGDTAAGGGPASQEQRHADDAFVADDGDFGRRAAVGEVAQRDDPVGGEVDVPWHHPRLAQHLTGHQSHALEKRLKTLTLRERQCPQQTIPARLLRGRHGDLLRRSPAPL
jgi:hypothetical protein